MTLRSVPELAWLRSWTPSPGLEQSPPAQLPQLRERLQEPPPVPFRVGQLVPPWQQPQPGLRWKARTAIAGARRAVVLEPAAVPLPLRLTRSLPLVPFQTSAAGSAGTDRNTSSRFRLRPEGLAGNPREIALEPGFNRDAQQFRNLVRM